MEIWGHTLANHKVVFLTDNQAVEAIINKTTSQDTILMKLVWRLVLASLKLNAHFRAKHIAEKTNVVCHLLSRFSFQEAHRISPWQNQNTVLLPDHLLNL